MRNGFSADPLLWTTIGANSNESGGMERNMSVSIDVAWKSLNKHGEELCGDKVEIVKTRDSDILILADGMGSGVKANILSTLTSKILATMLHEGAAIESCVETIARTLPICQERKVAYATFSILQIFHNGDAYLVEYDNPDCVFILCRGRGDSGPAGLDLGKYVRVYPEMYEGNPVRLSFSSHAQPGMRRSVHPEAGG